MGNSRNSVSIDNSVLIGIATIMYVLGGDALKKEFKPIRHFVQKHYVMRKLAILSAFYVLTKNFKVALFISLIFILMNDTEELKK